MEEYINKVLLYIEDNLEKDRENPDKKLTVKEIAAVSTYSEYHFLREFKAHMNTTLLEYVTKRKLIKASEDIFNGEKIADVSEKYGWDTSCGFVKAFKKAFGFSPSLLRVMKITLDYMEDNGMTHVFLDSVKTGISKEALFHLLQEKLKFYGVEISPEELRSIYEISGRAYEGVKRYSGEEYVTHLLNIALILVELSADKEVILAGMFCDVTDKGVKTMEELKAELPKEIFDIVAKVQDSLGVSENDSEDVILIRLAERLHNMRTIDYIDKSRRVEKAKETMELFMPIARKMGYQKLIDELNDLSMRYQIGGQD